jgi:hypothetical protein
MERPFLLLRPLKFCSRTASPQNAIVHQARLDAGIQMIGKPFSMEALASKVRATTTADRACPVSVGPGALKPAVEEKLREHLVSPRLNRTGFGDDRKRSKPMA